MKKILLIAAALIGFSAVGAAQQIPTLPNDPATKVGKLDNGLTYYIRQNDKPANRAEFYLATNIGAIQETPDQDGLAHFLEHMCFNGTKNFPGKGILDWLQSIGASFGGNVNASTGVEQTVYMLNNIPLVRPGVVDTCILIMHDYSHFVTNDPVEIDKERGVILEERRTRRNASWRLHEQNMQYLFKGSKYADCTVIGSQENLETFKPESLVNFYQTWCRPDMQALIVVGDINVDEVEGKIKAIFADVPAPVKPKEKEMHKIPDNVKPIIGIVTDPEASACEISFLWKSEPLPREYNNTQIGLVQDILKDILGNVMNERFQDIAAKPDAPFISASFGIGAICKTCEAVISDVSFKEGEALSATEALYTEIERMSRYGFSDAEIDRAKAEILSAYESASKKASTRKNSEFVYPMIRNFFDNKAFMDPAMAYEMAKMMMDQITPAVINQVAAQVISKENLVIIYNGPDKAPKPTEDEISAVLAKVQKADIERLAGEEIPESFLDSSTLPAAGVEATKAYAYGAQEVVLSNGVRCILLPNDNEKNKIRFNIFKKGGRSLISNKDIYSFDNSIWGLYLSNTGVGSFSGTMVSKMLAGKNLSVNPYIREYVHGVQGQTTPQDLETALQMLYLYFKSPRFDKNEYQMGIKQLNSMLPNLKNTPDYVFQKQLYSTLFNSERKFVVSEEVIAKAKLSTIEKVYTQLFKDAAGATCVVVGDFNPEEMIPTLQLYIGSLPGGKKATNWKYCNDGIVSGNIVNHFNTPMETPKVTVFQAYSIDEPYSVKKEVVYDALEGILDMVYTETLREEEGGTYGAQSMSSLSTQPNEKGILEVVFVTNAESADKLIELAKAGLRDIAEKGPDTEKFDRTKKNLEKNIPENRINNGYWMNQLVNMASYGIEYDTEYEAAVKALTPEDVRTLAASLLSSGNFIEVVMKP